MHPEIQEPFEIEYMEPGKQTLEAARLPELDLGRTVSAAHLGDQTRFPAQPLLPDSGIVEPTRTRTMSLIRKESPSRNFLDTANQLIDQQAVEMLLGAK